MSISAFFCNANECMNCKVCIAACNDIHNLSPELHLRNVLQAEAGSWEYCDGIPYQSNIFSYSVSTSCNHCDNPACVEVCPRKALSKNIETGIVFVDTGLCIGCGKCAKVCPYHAIVIDSRLKQARKCDTCLDLRNQGESPACVAACSMRCLSFYTAETTDEILDQVRKDHKDASGQINLIYPAANALLPNPDLTHPNLIMTPHRKDNGLASDDISTHK